MKARRRTKAALLALTVLLVASVPWWTLPRVAYAIAGLLLAFGLGLLGSLLYLLVGFRRWESRLDTQARRIYALEARRRRIRAVSAPVPYGYIGRDCR